MRVSLHEHIVAPVTVREGGSLGSEDVLNPSTPWTKEFKDTNPLMSSLLVVCLGRCSNFAGSESGQKQSVKLLQNMVYSTNQLPPSPPPPQSHKLSVYTVHLVWEGGGEVREKVQ